MKYLIPSFTGLGNMIQKTPIINKIHEIDQLSCLGMGLIDVEIVRHRPMGREPS